MDLQFFWKNVNKQLKSADFLSEVSKFQKVLLNKFFAFFILMSEHTLVLVVQPPDSQNSNTSIHVMLLSPIYIWRGFPQQFFYILFATTHFWILCKKIQNKLSGSLAKVEKTTKQVENQQIFIVTLTKKFSMPDYWYKLYKFTQYTWALNSSLFWRI